MSRAVSQPVPVVHTGTSAEHGFREVLPGIWTGYQDVPDGSDSRLTSAFEFPHLDLVLPLTGAWRVHHPANGFHARTGAGAIVCILDSGIDVAHPDFRAGPSGASTRILRLWDQTLGRTPLAPGERRPPGFNYGVEYRREDFEARSTPIRSHDATGHGTHIAGILAGSGAASGGRYRGMAPEADLVIIRAGTDRFPLAHILDGMAYCDDVAREHGAPAVLNLSFGAPLGPHDGSDLKNRMASAFATQPGRAAVLSAGNTGHLARHAAQTLYPGGATQFVVNVPEHTSGGVGHERLSLEVWLPNALDVLAHVESPNLDVAHFLPGQAYTHPSQGSGWYLDHLSVPHSHAQRFHAQMYATEAHRSLPHGAWQVVVESRGRHPPTQIHAWLHGTGPLEASRWVGGTNAYGINNAAEGGIVVGAYQHRPAWCAVSGQCHVAPDVGFGVAPFSSRGPSRDERLLPHLLAPGQFVVAPHPGGTYAAVAGTSYAAAVVSGAVALLFEAHPALTGTELRTLLMETAQAPPGDPALPNTTHGAGSVDVEAALRALEGMPLRTRRLSCSIGPATAPPFNLAPGETLRMTLRPVRRTYLRQALLNLPHRAPKRLRLRLMQEAFHVHEQEISLPEDAYGRVVFALLPPFVVQESEAAWLTIEPVDAPLTLHSSLEPSEVECEVVRRDSSRRSGFPLSVWLEEGATLLPVRWTSFLGWAEGDHVRLVWETAEEVNAADFRIERRSEGEPWVELGALGAAGRPSRYTFLSPALAWGEHHFRLRQTDVDGAFSYSAVLTVSVLPEHTLAAGTPYPHPARETVYLPVYNAALHTLQVQAWDVQGRLILSKEVQARAQMEHLRINLSSWPPGVYVYALSTPQKRVVGRLVRAP